MYGVRAGEGLSEGHNDYVCKSVYKDELTSKHVVLVDRPMHLSTAVCSQVQFKHAGESHTCRRCFDMFSSHRNTHTFLFSLLYRLQGIPDGYRWTITGDAGRVQIAIPTEIYMYSQSSIFFHSYCILFYYFITRNILGTEFPPRNRGSYSNQDWFAYFS